MCSSRVKQLHVFMYFHPYFAVVNPCQYTLGRESLHYKNTAGVASMHHIWSTLAICIFCFCLLRKRILQRELNPASRLKATSDQGPHYFASHQNNIFMLNIDIITVLSPFTRSQMHRLLCSMHALYSKHYNFV